MNEDTDHDIYCVNCEQTLELWYIGFGGLWVVGCDCKNADASLLNTDPWEPRQPWVRRERGGSE